MSIKPQDLVVVAKLIAKGPEEWSQASLATELCLSPSQVNNALKRLVTAGLITPYHPPAQPEPLFKACAEFFTHGLKYVFPAKLGELTRGVRTSYAAPGFKGEVAIGQEPLPVWPFGAGGEHGAALKPLYSCVPKAVSRYPDAKFYDLLSILDAIRSANPRATPIALKNLKALLKV